MECHRCGTVGKAEELFCRGCRAPLFDEDAALPDEDERVLLLAQVCELTLAQEFTSADFAGWLEQFADEQEQRGRALVEFFRQCPDEWQAEWVEEMEAGFHGVQACEEALAALRQTPALTRSAAEDAVGRYLAGTARVKEAMAINRRHRGEDDGGETAVMSESSPHPPSETGERAG